MRRVPSPARFRLVVPWLVLAAVCAFACDDDDGDAASGGSSGPVEVPVVAVAGSVLTLPCARPTLVPAGSWQAVTLGGGDGGDAVSVVEGDFRPTRTGRHVWSCLALGRRGSIDVRPGPAVSLELSHLPAAVPLGRSLDVTPRALDAYGNRVAAGELARLEVSVVATPVGAVRAASGRLRFVQPGRVELVAVGTALGAAAPALSARHALVVDAGPPVVELESPARGTIVRRTVTSAVRVAGRVLEDGPTVALEIDGRVVEVGPDGRFETLVVPHTTGLSVLRYRAVDQVGQSTTGARAVLFGPLRDPSAGLEQAARIFLPRSVLDDDASDLDDVAAAIELLLGLVSVPDQRISFGCKGHVELSQIELDADAVELVPGPDGLSIGVALRDVSVDVSGQACACAFGGSVGCVSASGSVATSSVEATVRARIGATHATSLEVEAAALEVAALDIHWDFLWGGLDWAIELFEAEIRSRLVEAVRTTLTEEVRANLQSVLDTLLPAQTLSLPPPLDDDLVLETRLVGLTPSADGLGFEVSTRALSQGRAGATSPAAAGAPKRSTVRASTSPPTLPTDRLGAALSLDIINDAIYSLYARGALDELVLDLEALGVAVPGAATPRHLTLSASLPPMLLPGRREGSLQLVIGDLHVVAELPLETLELYVSLVIEAKVSLDEAENSLVIELVEDGLEVHFEPASVHDAASLSASLHDTSRLVSAIVLRTLVGRATRIGLPVMDLSLVPGIPAERADVLHLSDARLTVSRSGYLVVTGQLRRMEPR